jgi:zeaxanthin glucosyltransferase
MAHFGLVCPPGTSHVTGFTTLARELCRRGHRATVFNILDVESLAKKEGVAFHPLGVKEHPLGSLKEFAKKFSELHGMASMRMGFAIARKEIATLLDEAPDAMRAAGVTAIIVDQGQPAGSTIAERLGVPFITLCNACPADRDPDVPIALLDWGPARSWLGRLRNRAAYRLFDLAATPIRSKINSYRKAWGMKRLRSLYDTFSPLLELAQLTAEFDFPRRSLPPQFHYIGLFRRTNSASVPFPFDRLDGRPMIYASLGTVRRDSQGVLRMLAEACSGLDVQLVISLGGTGDSTSFSDLPNPPLVVDYAPQLAVLERAKLTVCHAGVNTVLESFTWGVPVLAVAHSSDQFGIAARLELSGAGARIALKQLSVAYLRGLVGRVLSEPSFAERARAMRASLERAGGEKRAADLIEEKLGKA